MIVSIAISAGRVVNVSVYPDDSQGKAGRQAQALAKPGGAIDEVQLWTVPRDPDQVARILRAYHTTQDPWLGDEAVERAKDKFVPDRLRDR